MRNHFYLAVTVGQRFELLGVDRQAHAMARADVWEARLQAGAAAAGIPLNELPARKSAPEKVRLAAALKRMTTGSNRWLAERLQMGAVTSVSSLLHRFQSVDATESKTFKTILSRSSL